MKMTSLLMPIQFHTELKNRARMDGVPMALYLQNLMRKEWDWPVEVLPDGNSYRPAAPVEPTLYGHAPRTMGEVNEGDF